MDACFGIWRMIYMRRKWLFSLHSPLPIYENLRELVLLLKYCIFRMCRADPSLSMRKSHETRVRSTQKVLWFISTVVELKLSIFLCF